MAFHPLTLKGVTECGRKKTRRASGIPAGMLGLFWGMFRGYRYAQSPANGFDPSGIVLSGAACGRFERFDPSGMKLPVFNFEWSLAPQPPGGDIFRESTPVRLRVSQINRLPPRHPFSRAYFALPGFFLTGCTRNPRRINSSSIDPAGSVGFPGVSSGLAASGLVAGPGPAGNGGGWAI